MYSKSIVTLQKTPYIKAASVYSDTTVTSKACILYFHGGGLLYGTREDLPETHINRLTQAGYVIIAFDYPLAPEARLGYILEEVIASINHYVSKPTAYVKQELPFFLWGRSAGAYLCLLAASHSDLQKKPTGILSYYGYGFLTDSWFSVPSRYYNTMPKVPDSCLEALPRFLHADGPLDTHYSAYVYARQTGRWKELFYDGRDKYFFLEYSLRGCDRLPCPLFCTHCMGDTDVPFQEFQALSQKYNAKRYIASGTQHDFDREEHTPMTKRLLDATISFLDTYAK